MYAQVLYGTQRYDDSVAAARTALNMQPSMGVASNALECAFGSKGMSDEHLAYQRNQIAKDTELVAAFETGLAQGGYEGAFRRMADFLRQVRS